MSTDNIFLVPMALKHWAGEALKANQQLLTCLKKYPNPKGVNKDIVPSIQYNLRELSTVSNAIDEVIPGWRTGEESND